MGGSTLARRMARRSLSILATVGLLVGLLTVGSTPVSADVVICPECFPSISTPLGNAIVTVSATNVVTVVFTPTDPVHTYVAGVPFSYPPGPPTFPVTRNSLVTTGGTVNIDAVALPPGPPTFPTFTSLAVVSIHPPSPCRLTLTRSATSTLVVFTPR
jgi:hypothetical protein